MTQLQQTIEEAFGQEHLSPEHRQAIEEAVSLLDSGKLRVVTHSESGGEWSVQAWLKKAILLYFRSHTSAPIEGSPLQWFDKVPVKKFSQELGVRAVPPAVARFGAYVAPGCVLMPSYVNIGAYVDSGTMVDTWATVGSCAQIGKNVHLSGGVGIGGVLEPAQAMPVIIEDNCFVGSRAVIVEGVQVKRGAVIGAGVVLTASTTILDVRGSQPTASKGVVPENCVVIPGSQSKKFPAGEFQVPCALIIGERKPSTDLKTSLNQVLRDFAVPV
jgi:2,3,4,5-tetrahydropyridine-2-carboxylate N-succinyltransferase